MLALSLAAVSESILPGSGSPQQTGKPRHKLARLNFSAGYSLMNSSTRAVGQLKHEKLEVRLGAIFTLRQICDDYSDLSRPILETLAAYVRENRIEYGDDLPPADIREVMNILRDKLGGTG